MTTPSAPPADPAPPASSSSAPAPSARQRLFQHPWRLVIIGAICLVVLNLGLVLLSQSDTQPQGRSLPETIDSVSPAPGDLSRLQDTITADLRDDLTGVLLIDGQEVPEDQLERIVPLAQVSFRPGADKDLERLEPGAHTVTVEYWPQGKARPRNPGSYTWTFRAGA
jgi:hypothetical protein